VLGKVEKGEGICNVCDLPCGNVMWAPQRLAGNKWKVECGNVERGEVKEEEEEQEENGGQVDVD